MEISLTFPVDLFFTPNTSSRVTPKHTQTHYDHWFAERHKCTTLMMCLLSCLHICVCVRMSRLVHWKQIQRLCGVSTSILFFKRAGSHNRNHSLSLLLFIFSSSPRRSFIHSLVSSQLSGSVLTPLLPWMPTIVLSILLASPFPRMTLLLLFDKSLIPQLSLCVSPLIPPSSLHHSARPWFLSSSLSATTCQKWS